MSADIKITLRGAALLQPQKAIDDAIKSTYASTSTYALSIVRDNTPVRTGRLRDGWIVERGSDILRVVNDVPYAPYIDARRQIVQRSLQGIENYFTVEMLKNGLAELDSL